MGRLLNLLKKSSEAAWAVLFNGSSSGIDFGLDASLQDLADAALTIEFWVRPDNLGNTEYFLDKGEAANKGWGIYQYSGGIRARVQCATTDAVASYDWSGDVANGEWHHVRATFNDGGDRKVRLYLDDVLVVTSGAGVGAIVSDAGVKLYAGCRGGATYRFTGAMGWIRLSNVVRSSGNGTPPSRITPPDADGNTVEQWNLDEGTGTTATALVSSPTNDGTITNGSWIYV